jgi:hypothetical protein
MAQPAAVLLKKLAPDGDWSFTQEGAYTVATDKSGKNGVVYFDRNGNPSSRATTGLSPHA